MVYPVLVRLLNDYYTEFASFVYVMNCKCTAYLS